MTTDAAVLQRAMLVARDAVLAGGAAALARVRRGFAVETKADASPVTEADRESELAIIGVLRAAFPDHALLCEESGSSGDQSGPRWIVDPLDGTVAFTRGGNGWGPLVALEVAGSLVVGAQALPAQGRAHWAARGLGCFREDGSRVQLAPALPLAAATLSLGSLKRLLSSPQGEQVAALIRSARLTRCLGDVAACALVLDGHADAWLETGVQRWDVAAGQVLLQEAGATCTDFRSGDAAAAGEMLAARPELHAELLALLRPGSA